MGMSVGDKDSGGMLAEINVTPLVDVMLVLIIIFMVVAQALASGVTVDLPAAKSVEEGQDRGGHISIAIQGDESVYVELAEVDLANLAEEIRNAQEVKRSQKNTEQDASLLVKGDRSLTWKQVRAVMDTINEQYGTPNMLLAVQKDEE